VSEYTNEERWRTIKNKTSALEGNAAQTLRNLQTYTQKLVNTEVKDIEPLLAQMVENKDMDISPLLRMYDELAENTKFKLPSRELIKMDQTVFTKLVEKLRRAHSTELAYLKQKLKQETNDYIKKEFDRV